MSGFKKTQSSSNKTLNESNEVGTNHKVKVESKNKNNKVFSVLLPIELIERLKAYQNSENAKRIETQTYIFTQALTAWLDSKGFKK